MRRFNQRRGWIGAMGVVVMVGAMGVVVSTARGQCVSTATVHLTGGVGPASFDHVVITWCYPEKFPDVGFQYPLLADVSWSVADVGTTRTITAGDDPNFSGFVGLLTDGVPESQGLYWWQPDAVFQNGGGIPGPEVDFLSGNPAVDLQGFDVSAISMTLDSLSFSTQPLSDIQLVDAVVTLSVYVPEPGSVGLLALGAVGLLMRRRR